MGAARVGILVVHNVNVNLHLHFVKTKLRRMPDRSERPAAFQDRSAHTQDLLCDAAEALLREGGLASCTIQEVAARSGRSPGSVYRRFGDKDGMIEAVIERFLERAQAGSEARLKAFGLYHPDLSGRLKALVDGAVEGRREEWRLIEALQEAAAHSSSPTLLSAFERARSASVDFMKRALRGCASEIKRPNKERAIEFAVAAFIAVARSAATSDRVMRSELHAMLMSYLEAGAD
jgi:AcrR family transcriptional regulator